MKEVKFSPTEEEIAAFQKAWGTVDELVGNDGPKGMRTSAGLLAAFAIHDEGKFAVMQALTEYGQAMRGDWSGIDGRAVRSDMDLLASSLRGEDTESIESLRNAIGLCPQGNGHWVEWCSDHECEI